MFLICYRTLRLHAKFIIVLNSEQQLELDWSNNVWNRFQLNVINSFILEQ